MLCCSERTTNQLARPEVFSVISKAVEHYVQTQKLWAHLVLAMPDHLHGLLSVPAQERLDAVMRNWKRYVAKVTGVKWQDGFFDHRIRNAASFEEKAHYIRMNPVRGGLVAEPSQWPYTWAPIEGVRARTGEEASS